MSRASCAIRVAPFGFHAIVKWLLACFSVLPSAQHAGHDDGAAWPWPASAKFAIIRKPINLIERVDQPARLLDTATCRFRRTKSVSAGEFSS
jgi:hypothetical protein